MGSLMRLVVCGGLFVAGYYLGRQSYRLESQQDQPDMFEDPDAAPGSDALDSGKRQSGG